MSSLGFRRRYVFGKTVGALDIAFSKICPFEEAINNMTQDDFRVK